MTYTPKTAAWARNVRFGSTLFIFLATSLAYAAEVELFVPLSADNGAAADSTAANNTAANNTTPSAPALRALPPAPSSANSEGLVSAEQTQKIEKIKRRKTTKSVSLTRLSLNAFRGNDMQMSLSPSKKFRVSKRHFESTGPDNFSWSGKIPGTLSMSSFVVRGGNVTGSIRDEENALYRLEPLGGGLHALTHIDEARFPPDARPLKDYMERVPPAPAAAPRSLADANLVDIDVLMAFTPAARQAYGGEMEALLQLAILETNQTYENSGIRVRLNLVDSFEVDYAEGGKSHDAILADFTQMQAVRERRSRSGADMGMLIVNQSEYCGMAYVLPSEAYAFAMVHYECAVGYYTVGHEFGHIQGAGHNEQQDKNPNFSYGHGYIHPSSTPSQNFRTVMSYECPGTRCSRIPYWSNPDIHYNGVPVGTAGTNNNAKVLNETASRVAAFRARPAGVPVCALSPQVSTLPSSGGPYSVSARCSGSPSRYVWTVNGQTQPGGSDSFYYNFPANSSASARSFVISVTASNNAGSASAQTTLTQAAVPTVARPVCTLSAQTAEIPSAGGIYSVSASCSGAPSRYTWRANGQVLLSNSQSSQVSFNFPANTTASPRPFVISVEASNGAGASTAQTTLTQAAADSAHRPVCTLSAPTSIPGAGGIYSVSASCSGAPSRYTWSANGQVVLANSQNSQVSFNFPANYGLFSRSFVISVVASNAVGSGSAQLSISQARR